MNKQKSNKQIIKDIDKVLKGKKVNASKKKVNTIIKKAAKRVGKA